MVKKHSALIVLFFFVLICISASRAGDMEDACDVVKRGDLVALKVLITKNPKLKL